MTPYELSKMLVRFTKLEQLDVVKKLLTIGAKDNFNSCRLNALEAAAERGNIEIVKLLLSNHPVGFYAGTLLYSFQLAYTKGHREVSNILNEYEQGVINETTRIK